MGQCNALIFRKMKGILNQMINRGVHEGRILNDVVMSRAIYRANAKLSYPERAHKLWSDVDGKEKRSYESNAWRLGVSRSALFGLFMERCKYL